MASERKASVETGTPVDPAAVAAPTSAALTWSPAEVVSWLESIPVVPSTVDLFVKRAVNGETLWHDIDDSILTDMGVESLDRKRILRHLERLRSDAGSDSSKNNESSQSHKSDSGSSGARKAAAAATANASAAASLDSTALPTADSSMRYSTSAAADSIAGAVPMSGSTGELITDKSPSLSNRSDVSPLLSPASGGGATSGESTPSSGLRNLGSPAIDGSGGLSSPGSGSGSGGSSGAPSPDSTGLIPSPLMSPVHKLSAAVDSRGPFIPGQSVAEPADAFTDSLRRLASTLSRGWVISPDAYRLIRTRLPTLSLDAKQALMKLMEKHEHKQKNLIHMALDLEQEHHGGSGAGGAEPSSPAGVAAAAAAAGGGGTVCCGGGSGGPDPARREKLLDAHRRKCVAVHSEFDTELAFVLAVQILHVFVQDFNHRIGVVFIVKDTTLKELRPLIQALPLSAGPKRECVFIQADQFQFSLSGTRLGRTQEASVLATVCLPQITLHSVASSFAFATPDDKEKKIMENRMSVTNTVHNVVDGNEQEAWANTIKLLLLGAGESGKSTIFKQFQSIAGTRLSQTELQLYRPSILFNLKQAVQALVSNTERAPLEMTPDTKASYAKAWWLSYKGLLDDIPVNSDFVAHVEALWADPVIQDTYSKRNQYQLGDSAAYFISKCKEVSHPHYSVSFEDALRCRIRTTGIVETRFRMDENDFLMVDVGGQRNERSKWIHCFEGVTCVIFVAALSEYDQTLVEDNTVNRMKEALVLFEQICRLRWFKQKEIILFMNKWDLFADKITRGQSPLYQQFPKYTGPERNAEAAYDFIVRMFLQRNDDPLRTIHVHRTTATDNSNVKKVFKACRQLFITLNLKANHLLLDMTLKANNL